MARSLADTVSEDGRHSSLEAYLMALGRHDEQPTDPSEEYPFALSAVTGRPMAVIPAGVDRQGLPFGL